MWELFVIAPPSTTWTYIRVWCHHGVVCYACMVMVEWCLVTNIDIVVPLIFISIILQINVMYITK